MCSGGGGTNREPIGVYSLPPIQFWFLRISPPRSGSWGVAHQGLMDFEQVGQLETIASAGGLHRDFHRDDVGSHLRGEEISCVDVTFQSRHRGSQTSWRHVQPLDPRRSDRLRSQQEHCEALQIAGAGGVQRPDRHLHLGDIARQLGWNLELPAHTASPE